MRKLWIILIILAIGAGAAFFLRAGKPRKAALQGPALSVRFLDEDCGNAVIVQPPDGTATVINPASRRAESLIDQLDAQGIREISVLVTEPSSDSARAVAELQQAVKVRRVIWTHGAHDQKLWQSPLASAKCRPTAESIVQPGSVSKLSPTLRLEVLGLMNEPEQRDDSCIIRLSYRGKSILYVSELTPEGEGQLISSGVDLQSQVLAIGASARRDNPSDELLCRVRPEICILCADRPLPSVASRLKPENSGATLFQTGKDGIIEIVTDGRSVQSMTGGPR